MVAKMKENTEEFAEEFAETAKTTKQEKAPVYCLCGCGTKVVGRKAKFAPGHDMRVKSKIITNIKTGKPMFESLEPGAIAYAKEKWQSGLKKSIMVNAGKSVVKGLKFETIEAKEKAMNAGIANYEKQLAA